MAAGGALNDKWFGDAAQFEKAYKDKYGYEPDYHAASGVADVEAYAQAIENAGRLDHAKVRDALATLDLDSLYGTVKFGDNGQINLPQTVIQVQNGNVVPVFTWRLHGEAAISDAGWGQR